jgi:ssRNA-specific RNase YbeY (16S rRNA maturation enzyme)
MAKDSITKTLTFAFERETKNTFRYQEEADEFGDTVVGTLYVAKRAFAGQKPEKVTVTISA